MSLDKRVGDGPRWLDLYIPVGFIRSPALGARLPAFDGCMTPGTNTEQQYTELTAAVSGFSRTEKNRLDSSCLDTDPN